MMMDFINETNNQMSGSDTKKAFLTAGRLF